jgi:hypothetical protein
MSTKEREWPLFEARAKKCLASYYKKAGSIQWTIRDIGGGLMAIVTGETQNAYDEFLHTFKSLEDSRGVRHRSASSRMDPIKCPIGSAAGRLDDTIFKAVERSPLWIYDPCVKLRLWDAFRNEDAEFLNGIARSIVKAVSGRQATRLDLNILRNFLFDLHRSKAVNLLIDSGRFDEGEWEEAYGIVQKILNKKPRLNALLAAGKYFHGQKHFNKTCQKWFESGRLPKDLS